MVIVARTIDSRCQSRRRQSYRLERVSESDDMRWGRSFGHLFCECVWTWTRRTCSHCWPNNSVEEPGVSACGDRTRSPYREDGRRNNWMSLSALFLCCCCCCCWRWAPCRPIGCVSLNLTSLTCIYKTNTHTHAQLALCPFTTQCEIQCLRFLFFFWIYHSLVSRAHDIDH